MIRRLIILLLIVGCIFSQTPPPDAVTKVAGSINIYSFGFTFNELSGSGIVCATSGSNKIYSYGNPALLNLQDRFTISASYYKESQYNIYSWLEDKHISPFSSFNISLPYKYKIGLSYNNLYSWESEEMGATTASQPDGSGDSYTLKKHINNYSITFANDFLFQKYKIHYGFQLNNKLYRENIYTIIGENIGHSLKTGIIINKNGLELGFAFETRTKFSIEYEGEGLVVATLDTSGEIESKLLNNTIKFNAFLPYKFELGIKTPIIRNIESYIDYSRSYWSEINEYSYDKDETKLSTGIRQLIDNKVVVTVGYHKITTHVQKNDLAGLAPFNNELYNIGLIFMGESFDIELGYAKVFRNKYYTNKEQSFSTISFITYFDHLLASKSE